MKFIIALLLLFFSTNARAEELNGWRVCVADDCTLVDSKPYNFKVAFSDHTYIQCQLRPATWKRVGLSANETRFIFCNIGDLQVASALTCALDDEVKTSFSLIIKSDPILITLWCRNR